MDTLFFFHSLIRNRNVKITIDGFMGVRCWNYFLMNNSGHVAPVASVTGVVIPALSQKHEYTPPPNLRLANPPGHGRINS